MPEVLRPIPVEDQLLAEHSQLGSSTRALAVYKQQWGIPTGPLSVALWGVRDPGNIGTVIRSADAFGASGVVLGPRSPTRTRPRRFVRRWARSSPSRFRGCRSRPT